MRIPSKIENRNVELREAEAQSGIPSFEKAAREVHASLASGFRNSKHAAQWLTTLETYVFPEIGQTPVSELRATDFAVVLRPIWLVKPETASLIKQRCNTVMKWCAARYLIVASPVSVVEQLLPKQPGPRERTKHFPAMPWRDLPSFVANVLHREPRTRGKRTLEFLILTAARSGEVRVMSWGEIDFENKVWVVPAERMKVATPHRVPLSDRTVEILAEAAEQRDHASLVSRQVRARLLAI